MTNIEILKMYGNVRFNIVPTHLGNVKCLCDNGVVTRFGYGESNEEAAGVVVSLLYDIIQCEINLIVKWEHR